MSDYLKFYRVWIEKKKDDRFSSGEFLGVYQWDYSGTAAADVVLSDPDFKDGWELSWVERIDSEDGVLT